MTTIISGTNRSNNRTILLAQWYQRCLQERGVEAVVYNLEDLPSDILLASRYAAYDKSPEFLAQQEQFLFPADRLIFVLPEYNGAIPGVLKLMIDTCDIKRAFYDKKACLTGLSTGRAGNLRGLDHLTGILQYLKMHVYHQKIPLSRITTEMDDNGQLLQSATEAALLEQVEGFLAF